MAILKCIDQKELLNFKSIASSGKNQESWPSLIMDFLDEEVSKGSTVESGLAHFSTDDYRYTIFDTPGDTKYIQSMIASVQIADICILVVSAKDLEFEQTFEYAKKSQIKEQVFLTRYLGINKLVILVNKMNTCAWQQERFDHIKNKMMPFLK